MPDMTPVADRIIPPDPNKSIHTLSGILGIRQQQQNLQTGLYTQQEAQALAQQKMLETQKQQGVQSYFKDFDPTQSIASDGTLDLDKEMSSDRFKNAPGLAKPVIVETLQNMKAKGLDNKNKLASLDGVLVQQFGTRIGALSDDKDVVAGTENGRAKIKSQLQAISQESPDMARIVSLYGPHIDNIPAGHLHDAMRAIQMQAQSASEQIATTTPKPDFVQTAQGLQGVNANPNAPMPVGTPMGTPVQNTTPPANYVNAAGQLVHVPAGGAGLPMVGAPSGTPGGPVGSPGANPTTAQAATQNAAAAGVAGRVEQAKAAANNTVQAQDALTRALSIVDSPEAPNTGTGATRVRDFKNFLSTVGVDTSGAENMNSLVKNLARYEAQRATQSGLGGTDAARELAHNGSPSVTLDNKALRDIITQSLATEKALSAYAAVQSRTTDPNKLIANETAFRNIPRIIEGYEYGLARNKEQAEAFLKKHGMTPAEMAKVRQQIKQFEAQ